MGKSANAVYALEGSVAICGAAGNRLRDNLHILEDILESDKIAQCDTEELKCTVYLHFLDFMAPSGGETLVGFL
jgi:glycerol kinase